MVVFDASTAILLAKAELLDEFLRAAGQRMTMPKEVRAECCARDSFDAQWIRRAINDGRIVVGPSQPRKVIETIQRDFALGVGEASAIATAAATKKSLVATDDRRAIHACKLLNIPFTTALSVLVRMHEKKMVSTREAVAKLEILARQGRYSKTIINSARSQLEVIRHGKDNERSNG